MVKTRSKLIKLRARSVGPNISLSPRKTRAIKRKEWDDSDCENRYKRCVQCQNYQPVEELRQCPGCCSTFHLRCMALEPQTVRCSNALASNSQSTVTWRCPRCICCARCTEPVADPANVQCLHCARAWHGACRPETSEPALYPFKRWTCGACKGSSESSSTLTEQRVASGACTQKRGGRRILKITVEGMDNHWTGKRRCYGDGSADGGQQQQQRVQSESRISLVKQACNMLNELGFTPAKDIRNSNNHWLQFGQFVRFQPLYESAYQEPIRSAKIIYVCEFCLAHMVDIDKFRSHVMFCQWRYPPGNEIYRNVQERWNIWEVEGNTETAYCRNLCLMAKLFLSSKTMYHEVETFTFYLLTEITSRGCVLVGYFSKHTKPLKSNQSKKQEKNPSKNNNLSCLLTLPNTRNRGYGKLLIDLSYQLSKLEHKIGHPEHPLSDMGLMAYRSYWRSVLFCALRQRCKSAEVSIKDLSIETAIHSYDIVTTLSAIDMLLFRNDSYYIDNTKALNASLASLRRRHICLDQLRWRPPFEVYPHSSKMNSYAAD